MNDLCVEIGYRSINHVGEQLCGDHVDIIEQEDGSQILVLADGLGSGVKASILSTLTSKILSTMLAAGLSVRQCVETIAQTLPVCSVRNVAYSTFTIIRIIRNQFAEIIQYDNPHVILIRNSEHIEFPLQEFNVGDKKIYTSRVRLEEGDVFIAMSDGCVYAGVGKSMNFGWQRPEIIEFMRYLPAAGYTAQVLATQLVDQCNILYENEPGDDTTAAVVRVCKRNPVNVMFGPPSNPDDAHRMLNLFFAKGGQHVVCGGTTSSICAKYLDKPLRPNLLYSDPEIPPTAELEGVDLVTEGVITVNRVVEYAKDYLTDNNTYSKWCFKKDGASVLARLLFEEATDINFFIGRAMNPAHQNPNLPINFNIKMQLSSDLSECLKKMGKHVTVSYF